MITSKSTHHNARRIQRILATAIALWSLFSWHLNIQLHRHAGALTESHSNLFNRNSTVEQSNESSKSTKEQGAAACLLVNDENPRLPEWLAYHYHMLPLRSLIITIDPASRTSPLDILNRWRKELEIIVWEEEEFLPEIDSAHSGVILRGACKQDEHEDGVSSVANGCAIFRVSKLQLSHGVAIRPTVSGITLNVSDSSLRNVWLITNDKTEHGCCSLTLMNTSHSTI